MAGGHSPICAMITEKSSQRLALTLGREVMLLIKAPWIKLNTSNTTVNNFVGKVASINQNEVMVSLNKIQFCATTESSLEAELDTEIKLHIDPEQIILATL